MRHAMRAFGLNLKRWSEDYPGATVVVGVILASGAFFGLLAIAHGCETKALGEEKEAVGGCGVAAPGREHARPVVRGCHLAPVADRQRGMSEPGGESGQPPIFLNAVAVPLVEGPREAPAGQPNVPPFGPGGLRLESKEGGSCGVGNMPRNAANSMPAPAGKKAPPANCRPSLRPFFDVLFAHESVGGTVLVGDKGKSRGPYHIQRAYWQDGGGNPKAYDRLVDDRATCEKVMLAYFRRYEPEALAQGDYETLARLHNGGPTWQKKSVTRAYWRKVKAHL